MKKILVIIFILFAIVSCFYDVAFCEEKDIADYIDESIDKIDTSSLEDKIFSNLNENVSIKDLIKEIINGEYEGNINDFIETISDFIKKDITSFIPMVISILIIVLIYSILNSMTSSFLNKEINNIISIVCFAAILLITTTQIYIIFNEAKSLLNNISTYCDISFPILMNITILLGGKISSQVYSPFGELISNSIIKIIIDIVFPLITASIIIQIVSNLSSKIKLNKLSKLFNSISKYILTGLFSLYIIFLSFQGLTSGVIDTVSIKSAKYAIESYVPIVGGYLSDGYDLVSASLVLIKNSLGYVIVIYFLKIILFPVIKIALFSISLKFASAVIEPLSNNKVSDFLFSISKNITILISVIISVGAMFLITIMFIILSFNIGV